MVTPTSTAQPQTAKTDDANTALRFELTARYSDERIVEELLQDAVKNGTVTKLLKGKLKYPDVRDARDFTLRKIAERMQPPVDEE